MSWTYPDPFIQTWTITPQHLDHYNHVNNTEYIKQMEVMAWKHTNSLGLSLEKYQALDSALVVKHHDIHYLRACHLDDTLLCGTWVKHCDNKLTVKRYFEFIHQESGQQVIQAASTYVCVSLATGRPKRLPQDYKDIYGKVALGIE